MSKPEAPGTNQKQAVFLSAMKSTRGFVSRAADAAYVDRTTVYAWKRTNPAFAAALKQVRTEMRPGGSPRPKA